MLKTQKGTLKRSSRTSKADQKKIKATNVPDIVDLTDYLEDSLPSPCNSLISERSVGIPTVGAPTTTTTKKSAGGRPKESSVRNFFRYDVQAEKLICLVEGCAVSLSGTNTGNILVHLSNHPKIYKEYLLLVEKQKAEKERKMPTILAQVTLEQMAQSRKPYDETHER